MDPHFAHYHGSLQSIQLVGVHIFNPFFKSANRVSRGNDFSGKLLTNGSGNSRLEEALLQGRERERDEGMESIQ